MSTRIILRLTSFGSTEDPQWRQVVDALGGLGATHITPPQPELPDVATAQLPDDADTDAAIARIKDQPAVVDAEVETWRMSF